MRTIILDKAGQQLAIETPHGLVSLSLMEGELRVRIKNEAALDYFLEAQIGSVQEAKIIHERTWAAIDVRHIGHVRVHECTDNATLGKIVNDFAERSYAAKKQAAAAPAPSTPAPADSAPPAPAPKEE